MDAYCAVISLHNLGYQLKALDGDRVAISPAVKIEHAELIRAMRNDPKEACKAIQHLPHLCVLIMPGIVKQFALDLFTALKDDQYVQIVFVKYCRNTSDTEWVFTKTHSIAHKTMMEILELEWGVKYFECKEEGQRWGT